LERRITPKAGGEERGSEGQRDKGQRERGSEGQRDMGEGRGWLGVEDAGSIQFRGGVLSEAGWDVKRIAKRSCRAKE